jgi:orotate phosphoribosyltransferase-like protein
MRKEKMDIKEFVQRVQPRKKRSRLIPFADQIRELKAQGYTDLQIRDWLAENSLEVSRETVRKFIKKGTETTTKQASDMTTETHDAHKENTSSNTDTAVEKVGLSQADKIRKKLEDQKRDADSRRFKHNKTGNI